MRILILVMLIALSSSIFSSCNSGPKKRKDGDIGFVIGQVKFDENGDGTFYPCNEEGVWTLDGGIQYKGLRKVWVMWQRQHDGADVYAKLEGYYYTTDDGKGGLQGALTIENFKVNQIYEDCNTKAD